jgi:hypothetical protein
VAAAVEAGATLEGLTRSLDGLPLLQEIGAGPLLSRALEKLWKLLQDREGFQYVEPACLAAAKAKAAAPLATAENSSSKDDKQDSEQPEETAEEKQLRAAAEEAIAMAQLNFDENWHMYLKAVYATELVPLYAEVGMQLAAALLQVLAYKQVGTPGLLFRSSACCTAYSVKLCCCCCGKFPSMSTHQGSTQGARESSQAVLEATYDLLNFHFRCGAPFNHMRPDLVCFAVLQGSEHNPLPPQEVLQQLASYNKTAVLPVTGSILAAMAAAGPDAAGGSAAIMSLPGHEDLEFSALAKSCCSCNKPEEAQVRADD